MTRSFVNAEQMVEPFFESLLQAVEVSGFSGHLNADNVPADLDASYRLISEVNEAPDGLFGRMLIIKSEENQ